MLDDYGAILADLSRRIVKYAESINFKELEMERGMGNMKNIKAIKVLEANKVVRIFFEDQKFETMVCRDDDKFSLEFAVFLAYAKDKYKKEYTSEGVEFMARMLMMRKDYVKAVKKAIKNYEAQLKAEENAKKEAKEKATKEAEKAEARKARKREEQINIQKEAYLRAMREAKVDETGNSLVKGLKSALKL